MKIRIDINVSEGAQKKLELDYNFSCELKNIKPTKKGLRSYIISHFEINSDNAIGALEDDLEEVYE